MANWDFVLKFIICGDAAVGKSSLLVRLTDQRFLVNPDPTLGVEFGSKLIYIPEEDKTVKLQCWDTAGTESFRSITRSYYRGFNNVRTWLGDVREHADPNLTCILVGNKVDLCESGTIKREVMTEEGEAWAKENNMLFVEASAKSGQNVELAFFTASRDILDKVKRGVFDQGKSPGVKPTKSNNNALTLETPEVKQSCCG
ncbi:hypothetical protein EW145_g380 [Phellinidium pouzarii]|uniref:Uncharacterized protein n=1 Tax=Phellinidium pouzarii TaxID=167371 RepID=A0A4S4LJ62_9AGAM|nr:hypothetical protein EW145_g380 [Phellinidium pouzarii]